MNKRLLSLAFGLVSIVALAKFVWLNAFNTQAQSPTTINGKPLADKEPKAERESFAENGPEGRWSASIIPDLTRNSSNSPVVVLGTSTLMGNHTIRNLQLTEVSIGNYSRKTLLGIQLKWFVTTKSDTSKIVTAPGYTGLFEARVLPGETKRVEARLVKFSRAVKDLIVNGSLNGDFLVQVKVYDAEFADGTSWNDDWSGPMPGELGQPWPRSANGERFKPFDLSSRFCV